MTLRFPLRVLLAAASAAGAAAYAAPTHVYNLNGSFADSMGGPSLVSEGGTLGASVYSFAANQGLTLSGVVGSTYSIEIAFAFSDTSGYRKIIDFNDKVDDTGLYNYDGVAYFYDTGGDTGDSVFSPNVESHLILTRDDSTNIVRAYANGLLVQSFTDNTSLAVPGSVLRFFEDDGVTGGSEASDGYADFIKIYDSALSVADAKAISAKPVPEPASCAALGLGLLGLARRRRK